MQTNNAHKYTDEQLQAAIDEAFPQSGLIRYANIETRPGTSYWHQEAPNRLAIARAFLAALPERQQAAEIAKLKDELEQARMEYSELKSLLKINGQAGSDGEVDYALSSYRGMCARLRECTQKHGLGLGGEKLYALVCDHVDAQAAEIAALKAELAKWRAELSAVMPDDFKDWHKNDPAEWPVVAAHVIRNLRAREESALEDAEKAQAELAALRTPIQSDAGIRLGQVAFEAFCPGNTWSYLNHLKVPWEAAAQAVAAVVEARIIKALRAVPNMDLYREYAAAAVVSEDQLEAVRARLIAAVKGEGQAMAKNIPGDKCPACGAEEVETNTPRTTYACGSSDYDGRPETFNPEGQCDGPHVVVNELPQDERQPDLSGESEKQTQPALTAIDDDGNPAPASDEPSEPYHAEEVPEVEARKILGQHGPKGAPALCGPSAKPEPAQPWTPKPGDVVRLKSGGPLMTVVRPSDKNETNSPGFLCEWFNSSEVYESDFFLTPCLTPAKEGQP